MQDSKYQLYDPHYRLLAGGGRILMLLLSLVNLKELIQGRIWVGVEDVVFHGGFPKTMGLGFEVSRNQWYLLGVPIKRALTF